jgi:uncharacterized coiled-coil protein SlyX
MTAEERISQLEDQMVWASEKIALLMETAASQQELINSGMESDIKLYDHVSTLYDNITSLQAQIGENYVDDPPINEKIIEQVKNLSEAYEHILEIKKVLVKKGLM